MTISAAQDWDTVRRILADRATVDELPPHGPNPPL
jgi:hypothetical protein